jgi:hypothetical protein
LATINDLKAETQIMNRILFLVFSFILINDYSSGQKIAFPNLPQATYSDILPRKKGDFLLFNIYASNNIVQASTSSNVQTLQNVEHIENYYCKVVKIKSKGNKFFNGEDYYISLAIDSTTSFKLVDHIFEDLKHICQKDIYLRTYNKREDSSGIFISLNFNPESRKKIVAEMYGETYLTDIDLKGTCAVYNGPGDWPPLPPANEITSDISDEYINARHTDSERNYYLIEKVNGLLLINGQESNIFKLSKIIENSNSKLLIALHETNNYNELIKLIDEIYHAQYLALQNTSQKLYQTNFYNLNDKQNREIYRMYPVNYFILSLSDQKYINKN